LGDYKTASSFLIKALEKAKVINDKDYLSTSYSNLGLLNLKMKDFKTSKTNLNEALRIAKKFNLKSQESEVYNHLAQLEEELGDFKTSLHYYKQYVELDKSITNEIGRAHV